MDIVTLLLLILLPVLLIRIVTLLVKKTGNRMKIILYSLAFVLALGVVVWFFIPFSVQIPDYDAAYVTVHHVDDTLDLDQAQSTELTAIVGDLSFQRNFLNGKTTYHNNDEDYYYVLVALAKNGEIVFSGTYHLAKTPFRAGGRAYDGDMNEILNPDHFIDDIVTVVNGNT